MLTFHVVEECECDVLFEDKGYYDGFPFNVQVLLKYFSFVFRLCLSDKPLNLTRYYCPVSPPPGPRSAVLCETCVLWSGHRDTSANSPQCESVLETARTGYSDSLSLSQVTSDQVNRQQQLTNRQQTIMR